MNLRRSFLLLLSLTSLAGAAFAAPAGFLFVTFTGEKYAEGEQIYFALSADGRNWSALNDAQPVLTTDLGEQGARDPYLIRAADGETFYLIATDLSIYRNRDWGRAVRAGSHAILVWESTDLVNWSEPRLVNVAPDDAGCTWAPEAIYDAEAGNYLVFWASTTARDEFAKHRIWAARTSDFHTFSEPFIYIEKPHHVIDTTIVHDGSTYVRFTKDEEFKAITMERADHLAGPWSDVPEFSLAHEVGFEGPECYQIGPAAPGEPPVWTLILDNYAKGRGYIPFTTTDLASGQFERDGNFTFPFRFRHGSVLPLTAAEFARLQSAYVNPTP